jgi:hypothetical protein
LAVAEKNQGPPAPQQLPSSEYLAFVEISLIFILQKREQNTTRRETRCLPEVFQAANTPSLYFFLLQILITIALFGSFWLIIFTAKPVPKLVAN